MSGARAPYGTQFDPYALQAATADYSVLLLVHVTAEGKATATGWNIARERRLARHPLLLAERRGEQDEAHEGQIRHYAAAPLGDFVGRATKAKKRQHWREDTHF